MGGPLGLAIIDNHLDLETGALIAVPIQLIVHSGSIFKATVLVAILYRRTVRQNQIPSAILDVVTSKYNFPIAEVE